MYKITICQSYNKRGSIIATRILEIFYCEEAPNEDALEAAVSELGGDFYEITDLRYDDMEEMDDFENGSW